MGIHSRDYMRDESGRGSGPASWSLITWIIVINVLVYLAEHLSNKYSNYYLALSAQGLGEGRVYQILSYQFSHGHLLHLAFNLLLLFFVGRILRQLISAKQFLFVYLIGGSVGGLLQVCYNLLTDATAVPIVGASASVMAVIFALATLIPHQRLNFLLFFFIPVNITLKNLALIILAVDVVFYLFEILSGSGGTPGEQVGYFAHFGGMLFGWLFVRYLLPGMRRRASTPRQKKQKQNRPNNPFGFRVVKNAEIEGEPRKKKKRSQGQHTPEQVDAILDKISDKGMQSLTEKEKQILEESSEELAKRFQKKQK